MRNDEREEVHDTCQKMNGVVWDDLDLEICTNSSIDWSQNIHVKLGCVKSYYDRNTYTSWMI